MTNAGLKLLISEFGVRVNDGTLFFKTCFLTKKLHFLHGIMTNTGLKPLIGKLRVRVSDGALFILTGSPPEKREYLQGKRQNRAVRLHLWPEIRTASGKCAEMTSRTRFIR